MKTENCLTENEKLVDILYGLKRLGNTALFLDSDSLARRIFQLHRAIIVILEETTGHKEDPPEIPMSEAEIKRRKYEFINNIQEAKEIEKDNFEYDIQAESFSEMMRKNGTYPETEMTLLAMKSANKNSAKKSLDFVSIKFPCKPSADLCEALAGKGFTIRDNLAFGNGGQWLADMVDVIVLEKGEIILPTSKGRFDPWR